MHSEPTRQTHIACDRTAVIPVHHRTSPYSIPTCGPRPRRSTFGSSGARGAAVRSIGDGRIARAGYDDYWGGMGAYSHGDTPNQRAKPTLPLILQQYRRKHTHTHSLSQTCGQTVQYTQTYSSTLSTLSTHTGYPITFGSSGPCRRHGSHAGDDNYNCGGTRFSDRIFHLTMEKCTMHSVITAYVCKIYVVEV